MQIEPFDELLQQSQSLFFATFLFLTVCRKSQRRLHS